MSRTSDMYPAPPAKTVDQMPDLPAGLLTPPDPPGTWLPYICTRCVGEGHTGPATTPCATCKGTGTILINTRTGTAKALTIETHA